MSGGSARDQESVFSRRALLLGAGGSLVFGVLGARLYQLQVRQANRYVTLSEDNQFNYRLLTPSRGRILDRFGVALAENEENYTVQIVPENARDPEAVLDRLSQVIALTPERREVVLEEIARSPGFRPVTVMENLDWRSFASVNLHAPNLPGVLPIVGETRTYPMGETFAHVTGYVGKANQGQAGNDPLLRDPNFRIGRDGMEKALDLRLRGEAGSLKVEVDALGRVVRELPDPATAAKPGDDIRLTLDAGLQQFTVQRIAEERAASAVVIDVTNGDILALASYPAYDPNHFARRMSQQEYDMLRNDERNPLFQKAFAGIFPPGSTFKPMVALAAQRYGLISASERVYCSGSIPLGRGRKHCWKAHGAMDMHDAFKNSCDVYFYEVAKRVGIEHMAEVAREFGLGSAPDLPLPGVRSGLVPDEAWKRAQRDEAWTLGDTLNIGIGQGFVNVTPLQLAIMVARVASGRNLTPRLVADGEPAPAPPMNFDPQWLDAVRGGMRGVCEEVGGTANFYLGGGLNYGDMEMAGKSGTAQVHRITEADRAAGRVKTDHLPWHLREHALFIAYAPYDNPRYAVAVVGEHATGGSKICGPMARDILVSALERNSGRAPTKAFAQLNRG